MRVDEVSAADPGWRAVVRRAAFGSDDPRLGWGTVAGLAGLVVVILAFPRVTATNARDSSIALGILVGTAIRVLVGERSRGTPIRLRIVAAVAAEAAVVAGLATFVGLSAAFGPEQGRAPIDQLPAELVVWALVGVLVGVIVWQWRQFNRR